MPLTKEDLKEAASKWNWRPDLSEKQKVTPNASAKREGIARRNECLCFARFGRLFLRKSIMQRLTRDEFLSHPKQADEEATYYPARMNTAAQRLHRRHDEIEWRRTLEAIDEDCGYRMI